MTALWDKQTSRDRATFLRAHSGDDAVCVMIHCHGHFHGLLLQKLGEGTADAAVVSLELRGGGLDNGVWLGSSLILQ